MNNLSSASAIRVRPMQEGDLDQVRAIDQLSFTIPWPASSYQFELFDNPGSRLWVAETSLPDGNWEVVGMIVVWLVVDEAHVATFAVHPDYRGQGIGRRLLAKALRVSFKTGAILATLEVRAGNNVAQNLYRDFGFDVVGVRPHYYTDNGEDALIMTVYNLNEDYLEWVDD